MYTSAEGAQIYPLRSPNDAVASMEHGAKWFTTMDAMMGYFQIPIAEEDQDLTCFITPWGRYKFKRAPMGLVSSGDEYNRRGDQVLGDVLQMVKIVDDVLAYDFTYRQHLSHITSILERCDKFGITLNPKKFTFAENSVEFCGYSISQEGYTTDRRKVIAIADFPEPKNITDLRSFLGLVDQPGSFSPHIAITATPFRDLLRPRNEWCWSTHHSEAFKSVKLSLASPPILAHFDASLSSKLETDVSCTGGFGFVLRQRNGETWKLVQSGSRFLSDAKSRYAVIELEMAALVWAAKKCSTYLRGLPHFEVVTDHRPLLPILNHKYIREIENTCLQRMRQKLVAYNFTCVWQRGIAHSIADALSRSPIHDPGEEDDDEDPLRTAVVATLSAVDETGSGRLRDQS